MKFMLTVVSWSHKDERVDYYFDNYNCALQVATRLLKCTHPVHVCVREFVEGKGYTLYRYHGDNEEYVSEPV